MKIDLVSEMMRKVLDDIISFIFRPEKKALFLGFGFLILGFWLLTPQVFAQKLYMFCEGDYRDEGAGDAIGNANRLMCDTIDSHMPTETYLVHYNDRNSGEFSGEWTGPDISNSENVHDDILEAIDRCPAGDEDIIFFYWTGHGAHDDNGHYLFMPKGRGRPTMYRSEILEALKAKDPRLVVFITDSCNTYIPQVAFALPPGVTPATQFQRLLTDGVPILYANLFFMYEGVLDMNSSCPHQEAHFDPNNYNPQDPMGGTVFACVVADILENKRLEQWSWETFVDQINSDPLSRSYRQQAHVWQFPKKRDSYSIPNSAITRTGTWEITRTSSNGYTTISERPYRGGRGSRTTGHITPVGWSASRYHPENSDRIVEINGVAINSKSDLQMAVAESDVLLTMILIDHRTGKRYQMRTRIYPNGVETRLGIYVEEDGGEGVVVTGVDRGSPADHCSFYQDGTIRVHHDGGARPGYGRPAAAPAPRM